jgi:hypothetical protein
VTVAARVAVGGTGVTVGVREGEGIGVCVGAGEGVRVGEAVEGKAVRVGARVGDDTSATVGVASDPEEQPVEPIIRKNTMNIARYRDFTSSLPDQSQPYSTLEQEPSTNEQL